MEDSECYPYSFYLNSPCIWVQIHTKDLNNVIPSSDLSIHREVVSRSIKSWFDDGTVFYDPGYTNYEPFVWENDDDAPFFYGIENGESINLDPPRIKAIAFCLPINVNGIDKYITRVKRRVNFCINIYRNSTGELLKTYGYKLQIEARMNPSSWIEHVSSYIQANAAWNEQELNIANWQYKYT
ncbi:MAG: hypothetical protein AB1656_08675 [Candidatus Omnitrophota bacterium]